MPTTGRELRLVAHLSEQWQLSRSHRGAAPAIPDYAELPPASLRTRCGRSCFPCAISASSPRTLPRNNLDPNLVLALIRQESAFQETARSSANARGLMQVLPSPAASSRAKPASCPIRFQALSSRCQYRPGTRYLASLLQHYDGKVELALAAYNAGDSRVDRWLEELETWIWRSLWSVFLSAKRGGYVKQVLSSLAHYHLRNGRNPGSSADLQEDRD